MMKSSTAISVFAAACGLNRVFGRYSRKPHGRPRAASLTTPASSALHLSARKQATLPASGSSPPYPRLTSVLSGWVPGKKRCASSATTASTVRSLLAMVVLLFNTSAHAGRMAVDAIFSGYYYTRASSSDYTPFGSPEAACASMNRPFVSNGNQVGGMRRSNENIGDPVGNCYNAFSWVNPNVHPYFICPSWALKDSFSGQCYIYETCPVDQNCKEPRSCNRTPHPISLGSGAKFLEESDLAFSTSGLSMSRAYKSDSVLTG
jgi:hypothetical protein